MRTIPIVEAKSHFSALLSEVEAGEEIAITKHGRIVARIVPDKPRMAADVFRPFWNESDIDLEAPSDSLPESVPPLE
ncbi:MAG: type II toxin-antitoxin system prevent-host-death family antitoxin [Sulfuricella sp.]|nr:type II toxin-antitoxin system prevent-host-death family antitoxin [Sulfuricella sp.]